MNEDGDGQREGDAEIQPQRAEEATDGEMASSTTTTEEGSLDSAASAFLAVEERLGTPAGPWRAVGVEIVPADSVPEDYPRDVDTAEALELTLRSPSDRIQEAVYLPYPEDGVVSTDSDLGRLLATLDVPADRFGDLHGRAVPVTKEAGAFVVDTEAQTARGSDRAIYALLAAYATLLGATLAGLAGAGGFLGGPATLLALAVLNLVVLPVATYLDGWHLRSETDWRHAPGLWALLALLPGVNLVSTALYLLWRPR